MMSESSESETTIGDAFIGADCISGYGHYAKTDKLFHKVEKLYEAISLKFGEVERERTKGAFSYWNREFISAVGYCRNIEEIPLGHGNKLFFKYVPSYRDHHLYNSW